MNRYLQELKCNMTLDKTLETLKNIFKKYDELFKTNQELNLKYKKAIAALEEINKEELNSQRPGGGYSRSAKISYNAFKDIKE